MTPGAAPNRAARRLAVAAMLMAGLFVAAVAGSAAPSTGAPSTVAGCPLFPADNVWNTAIDALPVHASSATFISTIGASRGMHADFGSGLWDGGPIGIPYTTVPGGQPRVPVSFEYDDESDPGPYPIPPNAPIEGGPQSDGDRHVLVVDRDNCRLYEVYAAYPQDGATRWEAGSGAVFDLRSNALRPAGWTSADAAGLPILAGLVRYDEVASGEIRHALRFTAPQTRRQYIWPARHFASSLTGPQYPPMGLRLRLKAGFDISGFTPEVQVILRALKTYGMILADNGSAWYLSGVPDERWNNDHLHELGRVPGAAFEAVDESALMVDANSGQARSGTSGTPSPAATPTSTTAATGTATPARTATVSPSVTSSPSSTRTPTRTPTRGPSATATVSPTPSATRTPPLYTEWLRLPVIIIHR